MASSEGLASVEPWSLRQSFNIDSWLNSDSFSHDNDLLAKALHQSISTSTTSDSLHPHPLSPSTFFDSDLSPPQTLSNVSFSSDPEFTGVSGSTKRKRRPPGGKPVKRRSRVSTKKSQTTFIAADAANFRQMVQQVTGAKFIGSSHSIFSSIVKPEPHRLASRVPPCGNLDQSMTLPTLDTSSFLSNHRQENLVTDLGSASAAARQADVEGGSSVDLDTYQNFPTLESWKVGVGKREFGTGIFGNGNGTGISGMKNLSHFVPFKIRDGNGNGTGRDGTRTGIPENM